MIRKLLSPIVFLAIIACSEPFSFETEGTSIDVVDGKVSTKTGRSYVDIYRMEGDERVEIKDLAVNIVSSDGDIYQFGFNEVANRHEPIDKSFKGEVGVGYRLEASDSDRTIFTSVYDTVPESIDFEILLEEITLMVFSDEANVLVEKKATAVSAQIPLSNGDYYSRSTFRYQMDNYFSPEDSLGINDPTQYTLYKSNDVENNFDDISIRLGERRIDTYFIFVDIIPACDFLAKGFFSSDFYPNACFVAVSNGKFIDCCHLEESWWLTYEVTIESLSKNAYEYWQNVEILSSNDGLIFDTNPFPIESNISCNDCENMVTGSFRAVSETIRREDWRE